MQQTLIDGRYQLLQLSGRGGMAQVHRAHDEFLGRDVAIKILREQYSEDEQFVERFRREAHSVASLSHPNIVQIYDRGRAEDGRYYIVMEHVPGGTLKEHIQSYGTLEPDSAAEVVVQIAGALGLAHEQGVIHRDVKPQNVLITRNGDAKVADFGIARAASAATISQTDRVLGTVRYMSPEQAMGKPATPASDLYSVGVVLYEMLTGKVPFEAESPTAISMKHVNEPPRPPGELNPAVSKEMNALVLKLLSKHPEDRPADATEVVEDLERVRDGLPPVVAGVVPSVDIQVEEQTDRAAALVPTPTRGAKSPRRKMSFALMFLAVLVVLLGTAGWYLWPSAVEPGVAGTLEGVSTEAREAARGTLEDARQAVDSIGAPEKIQVPEVVGLNEGVAKERLAQRGFGMEVRARESSEEDIGRVLEQSVPGGEKVAKGSTILLAVGTELPFRPQSASQFAPQSAPQATEAPDLVGLSYPEAEAAIEEAGLTLGGLEEIPGDTLPAGRIVGQDPSAGTEMKPDANVYLTTSVSAPAGQAGPGPTPGPGWTSGGSGSQGGSGAGGAAPPYDTPGGTPATFSTSPTPPPAELPAEPPPPVYGEPVGDAGSDAPGSAPSDQYR